MSTIAIISPVKVIFEKRAATVEVDTLIFPVLHKQETKVPMTPSKLMGNSACFEPNHK